ncbi:hypothetical protein NO2_1410 [Candidatus Termititenax persephonae]|uniref:Antitoxin BrnA n=1 Tax=Candidatus Termititenax persephonae TaxID=2218525 RepID=A0A388TIB6_9BACT|nr:hypothetical protein NO2_1410 [Candidatus Termititenax persephonae]
MTITRMTAKEARNAYTPAQIKAMLKKAKSLPLDKNEIPTAEDLESGRIRLLRRGRPKKEYPKKRVDMRFDQDVLVGLKSYFGRGWSTKVNDTMRRTLARAGVL